MTDIQLPSIAIFGKAAQLNCTYELGQDQLYSIKWFFNDQGSLILTHCNELL